jgi:hypothetical protein
VIEDLLLIFLVHHHQVNLQTGLGQEDCGALTTSENKTFLKNTTKGAKDVCVEMSFTKQSIYQ